MSSVDFVPVDLDNSCQQLFDDDENIRILDNPQHPMDFIRDVTRSGDQQEAFVVLDLDDVVNKYNNWISKLPRVTPFYAVKCNDSPVVLKTLISLGASFDCASQGEINKIVELGVDPNRIIFANTIKQVAHIVYAQSVGVQTMTFDNEQELFQIKKYYPSAKLVLRVRCDAKKAKVILGVKFGALPKEAPGLIALTVDLGLELIGISFHVGSGCEEPEVFDRCIVIGRELFDLAANQHGIQMKLLDLGGGYPGDKGTSIDPIANVINSSLDHHFPEGCGVKIIAEPGRYFVASAFTVSCRVFGRRRVNDQEQTNLTNEPVRYFYYMNEGTYGVFKNVLIAGLQMKPIVLEERPDRQDRFMSAVWGPSCCGFDCVVPKFHLPLIEIDDWLVFENMGAYTLVFASRFNGFPFVKVLPFIQRGTLLGLIDQSRLDKL